MRLNFGETFTVLHSLFPGDGGRGAGDQGSGSSQGSGSRKQGLRKPGSVGLPISCPLCGHRFLQELSISEVKPLRWAGAPVQSRVGDPGLAGLHPCLRIASELPNRHSVRGGPAEFESLGPRPGSTPRCLRSPVKNETQAGCAHLPLHQAGRTEPGGGGRRANLKVPSGTF